MIKANSHILLGIGLSSLAFLACVVNDKENTAPNLLIVYPDQMRGQAMGFIGQEPVITPHLDKFTAQSLVLTNAVANYPVSSPSRACLMTGKYPISMV